MIEGGGREETDLPLGLRAVRRAARIGASLGRGVGRALKRARGEPTLTLVRIDWRLGDEVMALPVLAALRRADPRGRIAVRVRHPELLEGNPDVDQVNPPACRPDRVLDLKGEVPGEPRRRTLERAAGVRLEGFLPRVHLGDAERREPAAPGLAGLRHPRVAIHASSTQPCKAWGGERWRALAALLVRSGFGVVEVGRGAERLGVGLDLVDRTDLRTLARVLAQVDVVVGEDSGPLHLALAVGTPAVGLFGPTDADLLYPPDPGFRAVTTGAECRSCWPRRTLAYPSGLCPLARHDCMEEIAPDRVLVAVREAVRSPAEGAGNSPGRPSGRDPVEWPAEGAGN